MIHTTLAYTLVFVFRTPSRVTGQGCGGNAAYFWFPPNLAWEGSTHGSLPPWCNTNTILSPSHTQRFNSAAIGNPFLTYLPVQAAAVDIEEVYMLFCPDLFIRLN